jgi:hypothetical protein
VELEAVLRLLRGAGHVGRGRSQVRFAAAAMGTVDQLRL